MRVAILVKFC